MKDIKFFIILEKTIISLLEVGLCKETGLEVCFIFRMASSIIFLLYIYQIILNIHSKLKKITKKKEKVFERWF